MINNDDIKFIQEIDQALTEHGSLRAVAEARRENYNTLYARISRMGYRVVGKLVPIHAPAIDQSQNQQPAA